LLLRKARDLGLQQLDDHPILVFVVFERAEHQLDIRQAALLPAKLLVQSDLRFVGDEQVVFSQRLRGHLRPIFQVYLLQRLASLVPLLRFVHCFRVLPLKGRELAPALVLDQLRLDPDHFGFEALQVPREVFVDKRVGIDLLKALQKVDSSQSMVKVAGQYGSNDLGYAVSLKAHF